MWFRFRRLYRITFSPLINFKYHLYNKINFFYNSIHKNINYQINNNYCYRQVYLLSSSLRLLDKKKMTTIEDIKMIWRNCDAVSFDVDSTVIREEGIDELAKFCGKGDQVTELTKKAMQGNMTFQQSLAVRLNIIQPNLEQIKDLIRFHPPKLTPGIKELIDKLHEKNKKVFLISGGFRCLISPVAAQLNISPDHIFANRLKFFFTGEFAGFDENELTAKTGGKAKVIKRLKEKYNLKTIVHVGDGATDLEASPPADAFIGFGGNVIRESVKNGSKWFVKDLNQLKDALD
ncbi:phosphoserine phosphatase [Microplitis mediator]|uniref:phosphoserine phosphatase n=1 Tax=Microplitis mediator TaxID=375433 RepID=UPI0025528F40|nr:phosphoserine phosphatase [Microplitis mediator]